MTNFDLSQAVFSALKQAGAENLIVCAGARNAPLVMALAAHQNFKVFHFFEERSAAFFALGLIKSGGKPAAVFTTSGTAVAELLPAVIEANYQGLPLILVTADRPKKYRGSGAPQAIEQVGLFSTYVEAVFDLDVFTEKFDFVWSMQKPLQLNVAFDEPLLDKVSGKPVQVSMNVHTVPAPKSPPAFSQKAPLIILGETPQQHRKQVIDFIIRSKAPVYAESLSQCRHLPAILPQLVHSSEFIKKIFNNKWCESVVRIGGVPTLRFWRDLENEFAAIPVTNFTDLPFSGLARNSQVKKIEQLQVTIEFSAEKLQQIKNLDEVLMAGKNRLLEKFPMSEQSFTKAFSHIVGSEPVYLGNSLPIRNWDEFADCKSNRIYANRGANGIDGQISTYLGWSESAVNSFCHVGDLTALYDLAALGLTPQLNSNRRNILIMNNFGGQIFNRVFKNPDFINSHSTQFFYWAKMWNWNYLQVSIPSQLKQIQAIEEQLNIIEVLPDAGQTKLFWNEWDELCQQT